MKILKDLFLKVGGESLRGDGMKSVLHHRRNEIMKKKRKKKENKSRGLVDMKVLKNRNRNRNRNHLSNVYSRTKKDFFYDLNLNINIFHILIFLFLFLFLLQLLLYVIDSAGGDNGGSGGNEPAADLRALWKELKLYDEDLLKKPAMIFANKSDLHC